VLQHVRLLHELGLDLKRIEYSPADLNRIRTVVDRRKASEVFNNLIGNAIKYRQSAESLRITLDAVAHSDCFVVKVTDWGLGIDEGHESRIFDEGFRAPNAIGVAQGSGLGLWLAREYMLDMGGDLSLSSPRNPTCFEVKFQRKEASYDPFHR
jgi:signal transduction histidine kinase